MKDELAKKLVEVIGAIQNGVGKASDFAVNQLPADSLAHQLAEGCDEQERR